MSNVTNKIFVDKLGGRNVSEFIGQQGEIFYDDIVGGLRLSNGTHAGGSTISLELDNSLIEVAYQNYQNALSGWRDIATEGSYQDGWKWSSWNVNGENAMAYLAELNHAWQVQNSPSSPPTSPPSPNPNLIFNPPISAALYNQIRSILYYVAGSYDGYLSALQEKIISGNSLTVPGTVQTAVDEDLVLRVRYSSNLSSPPGSTFSENRNFTLTTSGNLQFPDGSVQTGASISVQELKNILSTSTDFASFKAAIEAL